MTNNTGFNCGRYGILKNYNRFSNTNYNLIFGASEIGLITRNEAGQLNNYIKGNTIVVRNSGER